jgi:MHS family proline/betaine transporter-like MFS transporter
MDPAVTKDGEELLLGRDREDGAAAEQSRKDTQSLRRLVAANIGNVLEWYDFAVFGFFSSIWSKLFFDASNPASGVLDSFAVFGGAFLMRPFGEWPRNHRMSLINRAFLVGFKGGALMGYVGDIYGRKIALIYMLALMSGCSFLLGCMPTYEHIGVFAPILLVLLRLLQGLSVGGQLIG